MVQHLSGSIHSAESLISELLDIAKLDAGVVKPQYADFPVQLLLDQLSNEFRALAQEKQLLYRTQHSSQILYSDINLLRRILQNLLANAVRYTSRGRMLFGCRRNGEKLALEVWDTGPGIPDNQRDTIFTEFKRLDTTAHKEGLGLGLATVQRLCRLLNVEIEVRSSLGKGSVFRVLVPLGDKKNVKAPSNKKETGTHTRKPLTGLRILCIDNKENILTGMSALVGGWGCEVEGFTSLKAVLSNNRSVPDIILADYHLENNNTGIEAVQALYQHWGKSPPCVVISADRTDTVQEEAKQYGFYYLPKPLKAAALRALLNRFANKTLVS